MHSFPYALGMNTAGKGKHIQAGADEDVLWNRTIPIQGLPLSYHLR